MRKYFFGWENIKTALVEIWNTLSAEKSKLSSKRLITFIANNSVILLTWIYIIYNLFWKDLTATDFIIVTGPLVIMGGYSLTRSELAKPKTQENEQK